MKKKKFQADQFGGFQVQANEDCRKNKRGAKFLRDTSKHVDGPQKMLFPYLEKC